MKALLYCALILSMAATSAFAQAAPGSDPIKGMWKLNPDKSKNPVPVPDTEIITIVGQESAYKLTFDMKYRDSKTSFEVVTDMKGGTVKSVNADGQGKPDSWRVTRQGLNAFDMEVKTSFGGRTDKYEVSLDGKTMMLHRVPTDKRMFVTYTDKAGAERRLSDYVLVFDRVE